MEREEVISGQEEQAGQRAEEQSGREGASQQSAILDGEGGAERIFSSHDDVRRQSTYYPIR
jgi:hypothetical protein